MEKRVEAPSRPRIRQDKPVFVYKLVAQGTVEGSRSARSNCSSARRRSSWASSKRTATPPRHSMRPTSSASSRRWV